MGDATEKVAKANPNQQFGIVDAKLAARPTSTRCSSTPRRRRSSPATWPRATRSRGKVGTYGGLKIPPVTIFMDGFADGVAHYNKAKSKNVQVLGWDKADAERHLRRDFIDQDKGKAVTDTFVAQGADVIMPVAGGTGLGTAAAAQASGGKYVGDLGRRRRLRERPAVLLDVSSPPSSRTSRTR